MLLHGAGAACNGKHRDEDGVQGVVGHANLHAEDRPQPGQHVQVVVNFRGGVRGDAMHDHNAGPVTARALAYVGMTRHREGVELFAGATTSKISPRFKSGSAGRGSRTSRWITRIAAGSSSTAKARLMNGGWKPNANSIARPKS